MSLKLSYRFKTKWLQVLTAYRTKDGDKSVKDEGYGEVLHGQAWDFVSRKKNPIIDVNIPDAVIIVPIVKTLTGNKICITEEFRIPLNDYEWGFPAGLIDENESVEDCVKRELFEETGLKITRLIDTSPPIYSSSGLSDESVVMAFVNCEGDITNENQEESEDIKVHLFGIDNLSALLDNKNLKFGAKSWPILANFCQIREISWNGC